MHDTTGALSSLSVCRIIDNKCDGICRDMTCSLSEMSRSSSCTRKDLTAAGTSDYLMAFLDAEAEICECGGRASDMRSGKTIPAKVLHTF